MLCLTPTPGLSTPLPPRFKPPQRTPNMQSPSVTPRQTPSDGAPRARAERVHVQRTENLGHTHTDSEDSNSEEQEDGDTSTPLPRGDNEGLPRTGTPCRRAIAASSRTTRQGQQRRVRGRRSTSNDGYTSIQAGSSNMQEAHRLLRIDRTTNLEGCCCPWSVIETCKALEKDSKQRTETMTDRSWRSLKKEVRNPATVRKSMMCSKVNASRVNFGRTGPSGEVGIRERLRRQLRRSPDPDEMQQEMTRDKGYGGKSKRKHSEACIMHDTVRSSPVSLALAKRTNGMDSEHFDDTEDADTRSMKSTSSLEPPTRLEHEKPNAEAHGMSSGLHVIVDPQIRTDPFVLNLMDGLAALENTLRSKSAEVTALTANQSGRFIEREADVTALQIQQDNELVEASDLAKEAGDVQNLQEHEASEGPENPKEDELQTTGEGNSLAMKKSQGMRKRVKRN